MFLRSTKAIRKECIDLEKLFSLTQFLILFVTVAFAVLYMPRLRCWLQPLKKQKRIYSKKKNRLAIIIPARNESKAIAPLFASIEKQTYPREYFDFFVPVKEPDDPTVKMTEKAGGTAYVIPEQKCKGDALDISIRRILKETPDKYDAFIVVDADCVIDERFLDEMNNSLASGAKVVCAKKIVKNYLSESDNANSVWSACNGLIWSMIDDLGNRYKSDHGITIMTIGTGLMLKADFIKELGGWPYRETLTEDIELMYDCMYRDVKTFYYSPAVIYVEESTSLNVTNKRRTRWLTGVVDSKRIYGSRIRSKLNSPKGAVNYYYTTALSRVYWFIGFLSAVFCVNLPLSALMLVCGHHLWKTAFALAAECFLTVYAAFFVLSLACLITDRKNIKLSFGKKVLVLLVHPMFYMGYIPIIARALFCRSNKGWEVIDRMDFADMEGEASDQETGSKGNIAL